MKTDLPKSPMEFKLNEEKKGLVPLSIAQFSDLIQAQSSHLPFGNSPKYVYMQKPSEIPLTDQLEQRGANSDGFSQRHTQNL
jgi:hypothetical protein